MICRRCRGNPHHYDDGCPACDDTGRELFGELAPGFDVRELPRAPRPVVRRREDDEHEMRTRAATPWD